MDDIKERIKVKEFLNWIKSTLGLEQTKKSLGDYVEQKFKLYTDGKARLCHGQLLTANEVYHMYVWFGSGFFLKRIEDKKRWAGGSFCECKNTFEKVLSLYVKEHTSKGTHMCWKNIVQQTPASLEWKIAKVFMPMGNEANTGPKDTDPYAMFHLMKHCDLFHNCIRTNHLTKSKDIRNKLFHSSENLVADDDQKEYFDTMIALLTDASNDTEVTQATRGKLTDDIAEMKKLQISDIRMTIFDDLEEALRIKRAGVYYDFEKNLCKNDPEKLRENLKLVEQCGYMQLLHKKHLHELQNRQLRAVVNVMQTECRRRADEIQNTISSNLATLPSTEKLAQLQGKVNVLSAEHKKLKEAFQGLENFPEQFDILKAKIGDWKRNLRREISQVESNGMIIVVIVTVV